MTGIPDDNGASGQPGTQVVRWRRYLPIGLILFAMVIAYAFGAHTWLSTETFVTNRDMIKRFVSTHQLQASIAYVLVYTSVVALSLPGGLLMTVAGGFLFGWLAGGLMAVIAATIGATLVFLAARSSLGAILIERAGHRLKKVAEGLREDAVSYLLFLRLVPIFPFWLVNLAAALFNIRLRTFIVTSIIGILPGTFAFAIAGAGLDSTIAAQSAAYANCISDGLATCDLRFRPTALLTPEMIAAFVALGIVALIPIAVKRWKKHRGKPLDDHHGVA
jgi:uncharacterized membrane protein YdjX (TVP38/TMEM64 family)